MGIKRRIKTSGRKFIKKHLALFNKLAKHSDGTGATDDAVQLFAKVHSISLANSDPADGDITATITVHGDLERIAQGDKFKVTTVGDSATNIFTEGVNLTVANVDGVPGVDAGITLTFTATHNEAITVTAVIVRDGVELSGSTSPSATVTVAGL